MVLALRDRYRSRMTSLDVVVVELYTAGAEYGRYKEHVSDSGFRRFPSSLLARSLTWFLGKEGVECFLFFFRFASLMDGS